MSRTIIEVPMATNNVNGVLDIIKTTLESFGFKQKIVDNETVWAKGDGVISQMNCVSATFTDNAVFIQGWLKSAIIGESALEGYIAANSKRRLKNILERIKQTIIYNKY